jgi:phosphoacetylglucosamine mutase
MSFDGDADRQIYFYQGEDGKLEIIDGDKQFALIMMYIKNKLSELGVLDKLSHILVQTAYCNSKVTKFLNDNGINNQLVKTGVKYAHPVVKNYDIGANDEPNGHGAVAFKLDKLEEVLKPINTIESQKLLALLNISNIVVGDAIANMLLMEAIMYDLDMSI